MAGQRAPLWIREPLDVFDPDGEGDARGGVVIQGNRIVERVARGAKPSIEGVDVLDARGLVLTPGLINTHHHFYQTLTRAYRSALNRPLFGWLTSLYPVWQHLDAELIDLSTRLASAELLLSGCTTAVDHHYVFSQALTDAIDIQARACADMGIRVVLTRGSMSLGEDQGGLPPRSVVQDDDEILAESERLVGALHDRSDDAMCQIALAPCSPFSVSEALLKATADMAARLDVGLHTHLAETEDENDFCLNQFGKRPLDHLADCGWLDARAWFAHGIHFTDAEIERLGDAGCGVAHCPNSNMMLGSGICRVPELTRAGVNVGLGVDGSASNDHSNLIMEVRQAMFKQRLRAGLSGEARRDQDTLYSAADALRLATLSGARLLRRSSLGHLNVDSVADIALYAMDEPRFSGVDRPLDGLLLSGAHRAAHVMVNGEWQVRDGALTRIDIDRLLVQHAEASRRLLAS